MCEYMHKHNQIWAEWNYMHKSLLNPFTSGLYLGFPFKKAQCFGVKVLSILVIKEKTEYLQKYTSNLLATIHF